MANVKLSLTPVKSKSSIEGFNNNIYQFKENHFPKRPALDLSFEEITYTVQTWNKLKCVNKEILHGVTGEFRSGELTAIMGPSGAGKSTLLNTLAGFSLRGSGGTVLVNGQDRNDVSLEHYLRVSCYIQQDDELRPLLSVREAMMLASHLKLGFSIAYKDKKQQPKCSHLKPKSTISDLLNMLGLGNHTNTLTKNLSGGQKKRLSIALELITNPPIIFLDEPTTGLDSSATSSCMALLKDLAREGRTVICTIHQPSALLFEMLDHLYAVASGHCIYQGKVENVVPFLADLGLVCPPYHNPADFLIEVAVGEYGSDNETLAIAAARNTRPVLYGTREVAMHENGLPLRVIQSGRNAADVIEYSACQPVAAPLWAQAYHLYSRNLLILRRNVTQVILRFITHILIALLFGYLYYDVGNSADTLMANYIFIYGTNLFLHYTGQMSVLLAFPLEFKVLTREHFNQWYSLPPYFLSAVLVEIPFQLVCLILYLVPAYYLTGQPLEVTRFFYFVLFNVITSLTAQGYGFMIGAMLPVTVGVFIGPVSTVFLSVFGFTSRYSDIPSYFHSLYHFSYFRAAFQGSVYSLYGFNRTTLPCPDFYCHFKNPEKFLRDMEINNVDITFDLSYIFLWGVVCYIVTMYTVWYKLNKR